MREVIWCRAAAHLQLDSFPADGRIERHLGPRVQDMNDYESDSPHGVRKETMTMDGRQIAALGPRYSEFKAVYGHTSGVALGVALAYGIDVDAFGRVTGPREIAGTLILKVWSRRSTWRMLWCYVAGADGAMSCFPVFPSSGDAHDAPARLMMAAPLGSEVEVALGQTSRGTASCKHVTWK